MAMKARGWLAAAGAAALLACVLLAGRSAPASLLGDPEGLEYGGAATGYQAYDTGFEGPPGRWASPDPWINDADDFSQKYGREDGVLDESFSNPQRSLAAGDGSSFEWPYVWEGKAATGDLSGYNWEGAATAGKAATGNLSGYNGGGAATAGKAATGDVSGYNWEGAATAASERGLRMPPSHDVFGELGPFPEATIPRERAGGSRGVILPGASVRGLRMPPSHDVFGELGPFPEEMNLRPGAEHDEGLWLRMPPSHDVFGELGPVPEEMNLRPGAELDEVVRMGSLPGGAFFSAMRNSDVVRMGSLPGGAFFSSMRNSDVPTRANTRRTAERTQSRKTLTPARSGVYAKADQVRGRVGMRQAAVRTSALANK
ncbi:hypothetical protein T484DRAFT_1769885 [Baffinella frigidus]|nr:hypothetical protein T484DRAFT_1769885 [Cryptophyta sp. CCMP2293]